MPGCSLGAWVLTGVIWVYFRLLLAAVMCNTPGARLLWTDVI